MQKWCRRTLQTVAAIAVVAIVLSGVAVALFRGTPDWYRASDVVSSNDDRGGGGSGAAGGGGAAVPARRELLARSAESKLIDAQNWAQELNADAVRANRLRARNGPATTLPAPRAEGAHLIEFTADELNALFNKWSALHGWRDKYAEWLEDPRVVLHNGRLILAGRLKELGGAVASFQFQPQIDAEGGLRLDLVRVSGGRLPLPDAVWVKWRDQLIASAQQQLPRWRATARLDDSGAANAPMIAATMSRLLFAVAERKAADPVLFLPLVDRGRAVPVKVAEAHVADGKLALLVEPLTADERVALLNRIKSAPPSPSAQASGE
jgi:hypothetical protein